MNCYECINRRHLPGDEHIRCSKPPKTTDNSMGCGGKERYAIAEQRARDNQSCVRCVWPGSGLFPSCYDGNTVFGCFNYQAQAAK